MNPETAYANINNFIKEDISRSVSGFFYRDCDHHLMKLLTWAITNCRAGRKHDSERGGAPGIQKYLMGRSEGAPLTGEWKNPDRSGAYARGERIPIVPHTSSVVDETCLSQS